MSLKKKLQLCREFGAKVVLSDLLATNIRIPQLTSRWKDRVILQWLREHYGQVLSKHMNTLQKRERSPESSSLPVWSMWLQGQDNAPEIVKVCLASIQQHCGTHLFTVITSDNLSSYISLPGYIHDRLKAGGMRVAHFSDVVRMSLLAEYGGLWLDATIFAAAEIPEDIFTSEYYTVKHELNPSDRNVSLQRWTTYLQAAHKNNPLCRFVRDMMLEYWREHTTFIDYVMMDYFFALAYEDLPECRSILDSVPVNNNRIEEMRPLLGSKWDAGTYEELTRETIFFKLTYKQDFPKDGTLYGHLTGKQ